MFYTVTIKRLSDKSLAVYPVIEIPDRGYVSPMEVAQEITKALGLRVTKTTIKSIYSLKTKGFDIGFDTKLCRYICKRQHGIAKAILKQLDAVLAEDKAFSETTEERGRWLPVSDDRYSDYN